MLVPVIASATPPTTCTDPYDQAQLLRKRGKLVAARAALEKCARPDCPALIVSDCTRWLDEEQSIVPSVVLLATDEAGANLVGVTASIDGVPLAHAPDGTALDVDPGPHRFTFERPGLSPAETTVLVAVGERNKRISVTLKRPEVAASAPLAPPPPLVTSPLWVTGLVLGGIGVASLATGAGFGAEALAGQHQAGCPGNVCGPGSDPAALRTAHTEGNVSTGLLVAGGVLAAAGITLWAISPHRVPEKSSWVRPLPVALGNGGGLVVLGGW
jgi:hypothetical protein